MNNMKPTSNRYRIDQFIITRSALRRLHPRDILASLRRHERTDWGDCPADVVRANEDSLKDGGRLRSAYCDRRGLEFWIITGVDRWTTVMLPEY